MSLTVNHCHNNKFNIVVWRIMCTEKQNVLSGKEPLVSLLQHPCNLTSVPSLPRKWPPECLLPNLQCFFFAPLSKHIIMHAKLSYSSFPQANCKTQAQHTHKNKLDVMKVPIINFCFHFSKTLCTCSSQELNLLTIDPPPPGSVDVVFFCYVRDSLSLANLPTKHHKRIDLYLVCLVCLVGVSMGNGAATQEVSCSVCEKGLGIRLFALLGLLSFQ